LRFCDQISKFRGQILIFWVQILIF
jgi:hypothetical protein